MNNINLRDGETHKILFSSGKLYLDGVQIAGEGIVPSKDIMFEFKVNTKEEVKPTEPVEVAFNDTLEVKVHDAVNMVDLGPGQKQ